MQRGLTRRGQGDDGGVPHGEQVAEPPGSDVTSLHNFEPMLAEIRCRLFQIDMAVAMEAEEALPVRWLGKIDEEQAAAWSQNTKASPANSARPFFGRWWSIRVPRTMSNSPSLKGSCLGGGGGEAHFQSSLPGLCRGARDHFGGRIYPVHAPLWSDFFLGEQRDRARTAANIEDGLPRIQLGKAQIFSRKARSRPRSKATPVRRTERRNA